jgi:hypothetical protein
MKLTYLFILLFIFAKSLTAQVDSIKKELSVAKSHTFLSLRFQFPTGSFGDDIKTISGSSSGGIVESIEGKSNAGMGAGMGYEFGITTDYFFDKRPRKFSTGMRITYFSFSTIPFEWEATSEYIYDDSEFSNLNFISPKAGIVFRLSLGEKKCLEFFDQVGYTYCWNGHMTYDYSKYGVSDHAEVNFNSGSGLRNEFGLAFRTGHFISEFGYSFGKIHFDEGELIRDVSAPGYNPYSMDETLRADMPTGMLNLTAGLVF